MLTTSEFVQDSCKKKKIKQNKTNKSKTKVQRLFKYQMNNNVCNKNFYKFSLICSSLNSRTHKYPLFFVLSRVKNITGGGREGGTLQQGGN